MSWEPHNRSTQSSNRWKPPSPVPSAPPVPLPTLTRETWRPESSWAPKGRQAPEPTSSNVEQTSSGRAPLPPDQRSVMPPTSPRRRERIQYEDTAIERLDRGKNGWQRDRPGLGGNRQQDERSWGAWNNKINHVKEAEDRRAGPSRAADVRPADVPSTFDRRIEKQDEAEGRSWSAWKSKVEGVASDDRRRGGNEPPRGRERDEGWGARRRVPEEPRHPISDRRDGEGERNWGNYNDKRDIRSRNDGRPPPPSRPTPPSRPRDLPRSVSPESTSRRSPEPRKPIQPSMPVGRSPPRRISGRRDSPDYSPVARPRAPLPADSRAPIRDRGSPDYGIGGRAAAAAAAAENTGGRGRSPESPARKPSSPRPRRREDSLSRSRSPPRRPRSPLRDARFAPTRSPPVDSRAKRPRRLSPDYNARRSPSPPLNRSAGKAPLPPQAALFNQGAVPPRGPSLASQFARMENTETQTWRRNADRPPPLEPQANRGRTGSGSDRPFMDRRPSPDYDSGGPYRSGARPPLPPPGRPALRALDVDGLPYDSNLYAESAAPSTNPKNHYSNLDRAPSIPTLAPYDPSKSNAPTVKIALAPGTVKTGPLGNKPGLRQFFEAASPNNLQPSPQVTDPISIASDADADMEIDPETPVATEIVPVETAAESREISERKYNEYLDTVAPYLRSAFKEWLSQAQTTPLSAFLVHYFGRQPDAREMQSIEQLMVLREPLSISEDVPPPQILQPGNSGVRAVTDTGAEPVSQQQNTPISSESNGHRAGDRSNDDSTASKLQPGEAYERLACVGEGTYGKVYKARRVEDGSLRALKRIRMEGEKDGFPVTAMREIKLLQSLKHENIIRLYEMMVSKGSVYMVFDYMEHDLTGVLSLPTIVFSPANLKSLTHQMIAGLEYLHRIGILHRDMKGSNILLTAEGDLKLADFGLARLYNRKRKADYTNRVITLWYRCPELLMGETIYGPEVDMWSAGCIMLEMFFTKPIFQGNDEIHQLEVINSIMGTPREDDWPQVRDLPWYELVKPKVELRSKFRESFTKRLSSAAMDVAEGLLAMNPAKRLSATKALQMPYFSTEEPKMEKPTQLQGIGEHHEMSAKQERQRRKAESR